MTNRILARVIAKRLREETEEHIVEDNLDTSTVDATQVKTKIEGVLNQERRAECGIPDYPDTHVLSNRPRKRLP